MKEQIYQLVKLQKVNDEMAEVQQAIDKAPLRLETVERQLDDFEQALKSAKEQLAAQQKAYRDFERDTQDGRDVISRNKHKLNEVKTNKEYQALLKAVDEIESKNSKIEDDMLALLDQIEDSEKSLADKQKDHSMVVGTLNREKEQIQQEIAELEKQLAKLKTHMQAVSDEIDAKVLQTYYRVQKILASRRVIVPVTDSLCQGCRLNIPPQIYNELQRCDKLAFCPNCQRIVYWDGCC